VRIVFRADASSQIGTGHVIRCLTLADGLRAQSAECQFICREHHGNLCDYIQSRGYKVLALPKPEADEQFDSGLVHARWLGVDWKTDADQALHAIGDKTADWMIVDHYALDHCWESVLRASCRRIMVIDDLADRNHDSDLLLDQNFGSSIERYHDLVPTHCKQLHGPSYALLKPVYAEKKAQMSTRDGQFRRVLIYFGGGEDAVDMTGMALRVFKSPELESIALDIVIGAAYAHLNSLKDAVDQRGNATIHSQLPDLADLMENADLTIGAGGATSWERCCLGLPTIVVSTAENQRPACNTLSENDLIYYLGHVGDVTAEMIRERVINMAKNPEALCEISVKSMALVDGEGVNKVVHLLAQDDLVNQNSNLPISLGD